MNDSLNISFDYVTDYVDEVCQKDEVVRFGSIFTPLFFFIVITLSLTGNLLVLIILVRYENMKSLTNIFILNLAVSDLVFTFGLPFWAFYHMRGWLFPESVCKMVTFVFFTGFYSSILFLTVMTIYRYLVVVHPLASLNTPKLWVGVFLSFLMWAISIAGAMPALLHTTLVPIHHQEEEESSVGCESDSLLSKILSVAIQNAIFLVAFAVMAFCYIQILMRIRRTRSGTRNRAVKVVFCIVAVFFLGWVPYNVVIFLRLLAQLQVPLFHDCDISVHLDYAFHVCRLIAFSHCCLNPVFYAFIGIKFRSHLKAMLQRMLGQKSAGESQEVRMQNLISRGSLY